MRYEFTPEDLALAKSVAKALEDRKFANKKNNKLTEEQKSDRLKFRFVRQLGELAVARLSNSKYRGDRQLGLVKEPGDVGFLIVQTSIKTSNELILTVRDHEQKRFKPFLYVNVSLAYSRADLIGWELADRAFDLADRKVDKFGNSCWYLEEKHLKKPNELIWLLSRWSDAERAWGFEPSVPQFCALVEHKNYERERVALQEVYGVKLYQKAVAQYVSDCAEQSRKEQSY